MLEHRAGDCEDHGFDGVFVYGNGLESSYGTTIRSCIVSGVCWAQDRFTDKIQNKWNQGINMFYAQLEVMHRLYYGRFPTSKANLQKAGQKMNKATSVVLKSMLVTLVQNTVGWQKVSHLKVLILHGWNFMKVKSG